MNNKRPLSDNINTIIIHASSLIESGNYIEAFNIINNALVTYANKTSAHIAMSDNTMYLYIMLEIYICEYTSEHFYDKHIFERYNYSLDNFKNTHTRLRFLLRRICFGFDIIHQYELNAIIQQQHITAEEIITTTKYCIDKNCWCDTMLNTYNIMKDKYPAVADIIYASCQHSISSSLGNKTMTYYRHYKSRL